MEKLKNIVKENWIYGIIYIALLAFSIISILLNYPLEPEKIEISLDIYGKISIMLTIFISLIYFILLAIFNKKMKNENLFLLIAIPVGLIYMITFLPGKIPDEPHHFYRAYEISIGHLVSDVNEDGAGGNNLPINIKKIFNYGTHEDIFREFKSFHITDEKEFVAFSNTSLYSFVCYLPQVLGITLARIFTSNIYVLFYAGRLFNFIFFLSFAYLAVKLIPCKKMLLFTILFLPIVFQEAISLSPDAMTIVVSLLLISYILNLRNREEYKLVLKDFVVLGILSLILALCKIIYIPICLLMYIIPKESFKSSKQKIVILTLILLVAIVINLLWLGFASRYLIEFNAGVDSKAQAEFMLTHPFSFITIFFRTLDAYLGDYISNILGSQLSILNIHSVRVFKYILTIIFVILLFCDNRKEDKKLDKSKVFIGLSIILTIVLLFSSLYVQWTPVKNIVILGVQGRYFIPILILIGLLFDNRYIIFDKKPSIRYLLMFLVFLNLHVMSVLTIFYK